MTESGVGGAWVDRVRGWTAHHFSISDADADIPRLLRKIADAIDELGDVEVFDVAVSQQVEGPTFTSKATVYFSYRDEQDDEDESG
jgi:hypothetical protein